MNQVVNIVELATGLAWICQPCTDKRVAAGEAVRIVAQTERPCDDGCWQGVKSPPVPYVPTSPDARLPTRAEYPRPKPAESWPAYMRRKAAEMGKAEGRAA